VAVFRSRLSAPAALNALPFPSRPGGSPTVTCSERETHAACRWDRRGKAENLPASPTTKHSITHNTNLPPLNPQFPPSSDGRPFHKSPNMSSPPSNTGKAGAIHAADDAGSMDKLVSLLLASARPVALCARPRHHSHAPRASPYHRAHAPAPRPGARCAQAPRRDSAADQSGTV
jgi:hypothetical protein